ncbi:hypothetical protein Bpfe_005894, partial [Biomphalaria pfeifferi]
PDPIALRTSNDYETTGRPNLVLTRAESGSSHEDLAFRSGLLCQQSTDQFLHTTSLPLTLYSP